MVKFDPDGFDAMMARIAAEREVESPYEELEPDYEYMSASELAVFSGSIT